MGEFDELFKYAGFFVERGYGSVDLWVACMSLCLSIIVVKVTQSHVLKL